MATLAFRLYFGGDVVGICVDDSVKRKHDDPEWRKEHKAGVTSFSFMDKMTISVNAQQRLMKILTQCQIKTKWKQLSKITYLLRAFYCQYSAQ